MNVKFINLSTDVKVDFSIRSEINIAEVMHFNIDNKVCAKYYDSVDFATGKPMPGSVPGYCNTVAINEFNGQLYFYSGCGWTAFEECVNRAYSDFIAEREILCRG